MYKKLILLAVTIFISCLTSFFIIHHIDSLLVKVNDKTNYDKMFAHNRDVLKKIINGSYEQT